jgi:hypothetical protein
MSERELVRVDAATFQGKLIGLSETIAQKILREGYKHIAGPAYTTFDIFLMVRHAQAAIRFFSWVNADEHRSEYTWREEYTVMALSSVRTIIDCLYNILAILENPAEAAVTYRLSGFDIKLKSLKDEEERYGNDPEWSDHLNKRRELIRLGIRQSGFDPDNMPERRKWVTMGIYIGNDPKSDTDLQHFLRVFTLGQWRGYSQVLHASFEGLSSHGTYYIKDLMRQELRYNISDTFPQMMSMHYARASLLMLCLITELQAYCHFDGARINERIHEIWDALGEVYEVKELYAERYKDLMERKNIRRPPSGLIVLAT